jgi:hypothetical protein
MRHYFIGMTPDPEAIMWGWVKLGHDIFQYTYLTSTVIMLLHMLTSPLESNARTRK